MAVQDFRTSQMPKFLRGRSIFLRRVTYTSHYLVAFTGRFAGEASP
jgi:hypothetical protein